MSYQFSQKDQEVLVHFYDAETSILQVSKNIKIEANTGLPAHSTNIKPPTLAVKEIAQMRDGLWVVLMDQRGPIWKISTKEQLEHEVFGPIPDGWTLLKPNEFDDWDGTKWLVDSTAQLQSAKADAVAKVLVFATDIRKIVAGDADHYQTASWPEKARRAERIIDNTHRSGDLDILISEATHRGKNETAEELALIQAAKAEVFAKAVSVIDGMSSSATADIEATQTLDEIEQLLVDLKSKAEIELTALQIE